MKKLYGYIQLGLDLDLEGDMKDLMEENKCERIFEEKSCDVYRLIAWDELCRTIGKGDSLVYPSNAHVAASPVVLSGLRKLCREKDIRRYVIDGFPHHPHLVEEKDFRVIDEAIALLVAMASRRSVAIYGLHEQTLAQFPDLDAYSQRKITATRCLQYGISERELSEYMPAFDNGQKIQNLKNKWIGQKTYRHKLNEQQCKLFEQEDYTRGNAKEKPIVGGLRESKKAART